MLLRASLEQHCITCDLSFWQSIEIQSLHTQYVVVALLGGDMVFLDSITGRFMCSASCCGELKAAPAVDPWDGHIWIASHGCQLSICTSSGEMTSGLNIPADQGCLPSLVSPSSVNYGGYAFLCNQRFAYPDCLLS